MKLVSKAAAFGAAAALTATGLVAASGTSANAATVSKTYTCQTAVGPYQVPVAFTLPALPSTLPAGTTVPSIPVSAAMTLPQALVTTLSTLTDTLGGPVTGNATLGTLPIPTSLNVPSTALKTGADQVLTATGSLSSFKAPTTAGTYTLSLPTSIKAALAPSLGDLGTATCTLPASQAAVGSVKVTGTTSAATPTKAQKKLAKDEKALKKAKKAYKKAHGAKKAKLHKKIVKLKKAIKKDKQAVKAGK